MAIKSPIDTFVTSNKVFTTKGVLSPTIPVAFHKAYIHGGMKKIGTQYISLEQPVCIRPDLAAAFDKPISLFSPVGSVTVIPVDNSPFLITIAFRALVKATATKFTVELIVAPTKVPSRPLINGAVPLRMAIAILIAQLTAIEYDIKDSVIDV